MSKNKNERTVGILSANEIKGKNSKPFNTTCGGLYRWWFPIDCEICTYILRNYDKSKQFESLKEIFPRLKTKQIEDETGVKEYVALYVGQSENLANRFHQHVATTTYQSTLRQTIAAIFFANESYEQGLEDKVSNFLGKCYFEWIDFPEDAELIETLEAIVIATGCYPLNLDANRSISKDWINQIMNLRKLIKNN